MKRQLWIVGLLGLAGCSRLNPDWCATSPCKGAGEVCDPRINTCVRVEAGAHDLTSDLSDSSFEKATASDLPRDRGRPDAVSPDRASHDAKPVCLGAQDGWACQAGVAVVCAEAGASQERKCPQGLCSDGHCQLPATNLRTCTSSADCYPWVCTLLLDGGYPKRYCAAGVGGSSSPTPCNSGFDCATGLCTQQGLCYHACNDSHQCPSSYSCSSASVMVEGIKVSANSCAPN